jgi:hypothetical protein
MKSLEQRWQPILILTEKMKGLASNGEWEEIPPIELERRALLETFFQHPITEEDSPQVAELIRALMAEDKALVSQGKQASQELQGKLNTFATGRKAKQAYAEHT